MDEWLHGCQKTILKLCVYHSTSLVKPTSASLFSVVRKTNGSLYLRACKSRPSSFLQVSSLFNNPLEIYSPHSLFMVSSKLLYLNGISYVKVIYAL